MTSSPRLLSPTPRAGLGRLRSLRALAPAVIGGALIAALSQGAGAKPAPAQVPTMPPPGSPDLSNLAGILDDVHRDVTWVVDRLTQEQQFNAAAAWVRIQARDVLLEVGDLLGGARGLVAGLDAPWLRPTPDRAPDLTVLTASPVPGHESSGYGWRRDPVNGRDKFHRGTDYRADRGTPVYAAGDGEVVFTGRQSGYGKIIYVDHGGGLVTRYAHLNSIEVEPGDVVAAAGLIGRVGSTGRATGPHLHFEIRIDGRAVDPVQAYEVAELQRKEPGPSARLAAMTLAPAVQEQRVDRHDPPRRSGPRPGRHRPKKPTS